MDIEDYADISKFIWVIGFQLAFVASLLMIAIANRLGVRKH